MLVAEADLNTKGVGQNYPLPMGIPRAAKFCPPTLLRFAAPAVCSAPKSLPYDDALQAIIPWGPKEAS